ncbi:Acetylornithine deacetylase/Succinyl-diaminopimelate desuccinylase [Lentibacillus halodurans]|uniref:Acetylornithine deacetylase/Succinyl-diaminopimelate desuccinylase n=1 Tax=Lentibacillus halodurans TaxID=237679 RepID=A0A1I0YDW9_9BACI|nr:M20/M25/M40 family metallo-hydrolase [Lentibacillus halodurans]SFB10423.1 Acetylornithine deacetylase/Succinyl-diaminopimelate desuccinylase [Lentibacillus halodurans]
MQNIKAYIEENREYYINWLKEFCEIPSVAAQNRGMTESVTYLKELFNEAFDQSPEVLETKGYPVVFSHLKGTEDMTLSFYNHYDVQPEDPVELWDTPPFEPTIIGEQMYARGIADNKGNLIARLAAIHAIKNVTGELPINIKFIFEGEEEIGSVSLPEFSDRYADKIQADGCVWEFGYRDGDHRLQLSLGVKGMLYVELFSRGANTDLHSAQASIVESPVWRLVWALNLLKDENEKILIPGFYDDIIPLTEEDQEMIEHYCLNEDFLLDHLDISNFVNGLEGEKLKVKHIFEPTCNICGIQSGYTGEGSKTVLPSKAFAKVDFRLVPGQDPEKILRDLRNYLDDHGFTDIGIRSFTKEEAARTSPNEQITIAAINTIQASTNEMPNVIPNTPGTGPMFELCQKHGIPAVSFGVGHFASNNHAPNENIFIEDFLEGIKMMASFVFHFKDEMEKREEESYDKAKR